MRSGKFKRWAPKSKLQCTAFTNGKPDSSNTASREFCISHPSKKSSKFFEVGWYSIRDESTSSRLFPVKPVVLFAGEQENFNGDKKFFLQLWAVFYIIKRIRQEKEEIVRKILKNLGELVGYASL